MFIQNILFNLRSSYTYRLLSIFVFTITPVSLKADFNGLSSDSRINSFVYIAFLLLSILNLFIYRYRTQSLRNSNKLLREREVTAREVLRQRNLLSSRNKSIEDSLKYAQGIQEAMLIKPSEIHKMFPDSFILQKPKEIVSGDFYWGKKIGDKIFLAAVDCTGHGVPGAFMSLIGLELFRQIITVKKIYTPSLVLDEMNLSFDAIFDNYGDISQKDGMDLTLCVINTNSNILEFSGAFNPLYIVRDREIIEIKGDKTMVGPYIGFERKNFTNHEIQLEPEDKIYMFSDGYADQFGGPEGKKFKYRRFRHLLLSLCDQPLSMQKEILENSLNDWKGNLEQVDDILVIGIVPYHHPLSSKALAKEDHYSKSNNLMILSTTSST